MSSTKKATYQSDVGIGAKLRELRTLRGLSMQWMGDAVGITFQQIQKYESGANRISASLLYRMAGLLGVDINEFFPTDRQPPKGCDRTLLELGKLYDGLSENQREFLLKIARGVGGNFGTQAA